MIGDKYRRIRLDLFVVQVSVDNLKSYFSAVFYRVPLQSVLLCEIPNSVLPPSSAVGCVLCSDCCPAERPRFYYDREEASRSDAV